MLSKHLSFKQQYSKTLAMITKYQYDYLYKAAKGYTLIEILVTLSLSTLLLSSYPSISGIYKRLTQKSDVRALQNILAQARNRSLAYYDVTRVCVIDTEGQCIDAAGVILGSYSQQQQKNHIITQYRLKQAGAKIMLRAGLEFAQLSFSADGTAHIIGSLYYCPAAPRNKTIPRLSLSMGGYVRLSEVSAMHCDES